MRKRIGKERVYSSGTNNEEKILCSGSRLKDKNTLIWEKIQNECKKIRL